MKRESIVSVYKVKGVFQILTPLFLFMYFFTYGVNYYMLVAGVASGIFLNLVWTAMFHRVISHRITNLRPILLHKLLTYLSTVTIITPPIAWAANHHLHHKFVDTEKDPHSPLHIGFWKSMSFLNHQEFSEVFKKLSYSEKKQTLKVINYYTKSKTLSFIDQYFLPLLFFHIILLSIIDITFLVYFWAIPVVMAHLAEVLVVINHGGKIGGTPGKKNHAARNKFNFWIFTGGEGDHADHHDNPYTTDWFNNIIKKVL